MILRLPSGLVTPDSASQEGVRGVDGDQVGAGGGHEIALHLRALAGTQQPVVDEDTGQLVADGALHQCGGHRRVHAAGQPADRVPVADLGAHLLDQRIGDVGGRPVRAEPGEVVQEPAEHLLPVRGVHDLRVVLHPGQAPVRFSKPATAAPALLATTSNPSGAAVTASPWLIQTGWTLGSPECSSPPVTFSSVRPYSLVPVWATVPPSACAMA